MTIKKGIVFSLLLFSTFTFSAEKTKVLQNGLNDYNGCVDSYLYRLGDDPSSVDKNFHDNPYLMTAN